MISFNNLGNLGRLGNQMFQYAALKGIAKKHGYMFIIPPREFFGTKDKNVNPNVDSLYSVFDIERRNNIFGSANPVYQEKGFEFDEELFNNCPPNIDLFGYFQSEKYFKHIEEEIRSDFAFKEDVFNVCKKFVSSFDTPVISLHIRRGDYVGNDHHPLQPMEYYKKALEQFDSNLPVLVFSDDPYWCLDEDFFDDERFLISQDNDVAHDLCTMSLCDFHIIANSSLSWWGAWLANSKKTIAPSNWFSGHLSNSNTKDLYCENWLIL